MNKDKKIRLTIIVSFTLLGLSVVSSFIALMKTYSLVGTTDISDEIVNTSLTQAKQLVTFSYVLGGIGLTGMFLCIYWKYTKKKS